MPARKTILGIIINDVCREWSKGCLPIRVHMRLPHGMVYCRHKRHVAMGRSNKLSRHKRCRNKSRDLRHRRTCVECSDSDSWTEVGIVLRIEDSVENGDADSAADRAHSVEDANAEAELVLRNAELRDREAELGGSADTQAGYGREDDGSGNGGCGLEDSDCRGLVSMRGGGKGRRKRTEALPNEDTAGVEDIGPFVLPGILEDPA